MGHRDDELLFNEADLRATLDAQRARMLQAIERYDGNRLLNANVEDLIDYFAAEHGVEPILIDEKGISASQDETRIDVTGRFEYGGWDDERIVVPGTEITFHVPYSGDKELFKCRPSSFTRNPPRARVLASELVITYAAPSVDARVAKQYLDEQLGKLRQYVGWSHQQVSEFNNSLKGQAREAVESRRGRLLANQNTVASLGFPIRSRSDAPKTFTLPDVRKKAVPKPPPASSAAYVPEPALDDGTYQHILGVLGNMVRVMEQSPEAFSEMNEQDLRSHFLVQLNGQFEGRATGETFRGSGRTDILLEERDRSVFIAECKFWDGPKSLLGALDQLLDYATWRDAKAAVLMFSRNSDFSAVVAQVSSGLAQHPQTRGEVETLGETMSRLRLRQRQDSAREIVVTVMLFNVPSKRAVSERLQARKGRSTDAQ